MNVEMIGPVSAEVRLAGGLVRFRVPLAAIEPSLIESTPGREKVLAYRAVLLPWTEPLLALGLVAEKLGLTRLFALEQENE